MQRKWVLRKVLKVKCPHTFEMNFKTVSQSNHLRNFIFVLLFVTDLSVNLTQISVNLNASLYFGRDGIVTTDELFDAIRKLRNAPDETKTQRLIEVLDEDRDGELDLDELRKVSLSSLSFSLTIQV